MLDFIDKYNPKEVQPYNIDDLRKQTINNIKSVLRVNNNEEVLRYMGARPPDSRYLCANDLY